jgi:hypothetical protein
MFTHFSKEKSSLRATVYKSSNVWPQAALISAHSTCKSTCEFPSRTGKSGWTYWDAGHSSQSQAIDCAENAIVPYAESVVVYVRSFQFFQSSGVSSIRSSDGSELRCLFGGPKLLGVIRSPKSA